MAATASEVRKILSQVLGNFGPAIDAATGDLKEDVAANPPKPSMIEQLTTLQKQKRGNVQKPPGPDIFRGTSAENARLWKTTLEHYLHYCGYTTHEQKMPLVKMFLGDSALIWFEGLTAQQKGNYDDFLKAFKETFTAESVNYSEARSLIARKQAMDEDAESYVDEVERRGNKVGWEKERIIQQILSGVNARLKPHVLLHKPTTLQECRRVVKMAEEATREQFADIAGIQTALKDLVTQLKTGSEEKKVAVMQATAPVPTLPVQPHLNPMMGTGNYYQGGGQYTNFRRQGQGRGRGRGNYRPYMPTFIIQNDRSGPRRGFNRNNNGPRRFNGQYNGQYSGQYNGQNGQNQTRNNGCWTCGSNAHFQSQCPQNVNNTIVCEKCNGQGHGPANCPMNNKFQRRAGPGRGRPVKEFQEN